VCYVIGRSKKGVRRIAKGTDERTNHGTTGTSQ
jgi:hypothetical protein